MNWQYRMPVRVIGGRGCLLRESALIADLGKRALVVTGKHSARRCGALADVEAALTSIGISWVLFDEVEPNPSIETVRRAAELARLESVDFILGIGGGSPLDAAKAIAVLATNTLTDDDLFAGPWPNAPLPIVAIPTTSGTGSEVTPYAILTDHALKMKRNLSGPALFPQLAYCDAGYTDSLPADVTNNTAVDALSHALEGFLSVKSQPMSDAIARESLAIVGDALRRLTTESPTPALRDRLMLGSTLAGMVITHTGTTALHAMGYALTIFRNVDHGRANGLLMAPYLQFVAQAAPDRMQEALDAMGFRDIPALARVLHMLLGSEIRLSAEEIRDFAAITVKVRNLPNTLRVPTESDLAELFGTLA
jgi:alcohol dehydrogenase class IV